MKTRLLFAICFFSIITQSQNIFKDDLSSYTVSAPLHGQGLWSHTNDATNGFYGAGACQPLTSGGTCSGSNVLFTSVSYLNYGSSPTCLEIAGQLDGIGHPISPIVTDGDLYVSFVLNLATAPATGSAIDFFRVSNSDTSLVTFRLLVQDNGAGQYQVGIRKGASANLTVYTTAALNYNQDNLIILKYSNNPTAINDDVLNVYVNPDYASGEPASPSATTNTGVDQTGDIDRLFFRLNYNPVGTLPTGVAGLVSAARTWFDLGFIPLSVNQFNANNFNIMGNKASKGLLSITTQLALTNTTLNIYTITGQLLETQKINLNENNNEVAINPIHDNSVYIVELITENGSKFSKKIIVN